jgi:TetR/AcrR family transcriptional repressor of nem operon
MQEELNIIDLLARMLPGKTAAAKRKQSIIVLAGLVGAMVLARSIPDAPLSREILTTMSAAIPDSVRSNRRHRNHRPSHRRSPRS